MADPLFFRPQQIDLLIGGDLFYESLGNEKIRIGPGLPFLLKTEFGWVVVEGGLKFQTDNNCLMNVRKC